MSTTVEQVEPTLEVLEDRRDALRTQAENLAQRIASLEEELPQLESDYERTDELVTARSRLDATRRALSDAESRLTLLNEQIEASEQAQYEAGILEQMGEVSLTARETLNDIERELEQAARAMRKSASRVQELLVKREEQRARFYALGEKVAPGMGGPTSRLSPLSRDGGELGRRVTRLLRRLPSDEARAAVLSYTSERAGLRASDEARLSDVLDLDTLTQLMLRVADSHTVAQQNTEDLKEITDAYSVAVRRYQHRKFSV